MTRDFAEVAEAAVEELLELSPENATYLGDHRFDERLDDLSDSGQEHAARVLRARRDELDCLDLDVLDVPDAVDADLLRTEIDRRLYGLDVLRESTWNPLVWLPGEAVYSLLAWDGTPAADRLRSLAARLGAVPDRMSQAREALQRMPRVHVETAVGQAAGALALIGDGVAGLLEEEPGLRARVVPAQEAALAAVSAFRDWLAERVDDADGDPRIGPAAFAGKLHLTLDAELSAEQVVARAREHLREVAAELAETARWWTGERGGSDADAVRSALDRAAAEAPDDASIVALARQNLAEATETVRREGLVTLPDEPCEIQVMPEFRRGVAVAYCDAPGPFETGGTTYFAISPSPADWPAERVRSFYREYNTAMVTNLTVHEAMPGHVLQLAHGRRYQGRTRVRRLVSSGSFVEGWAVHAERLMVEAGHGGLPVRLQQLKMQLRTTINALLDAGVHAEGMGEDEALDLMTRTGFQEPGEAIGKWRRALLTSAQLSTYFVGYLELEPVVRAVAASPGAGARYDAVLAHGAPAPRHLRALVESRR